MKIFDLLKDHELGNSSFQDVYLVTIRAGGTIYGMYKQALRELYRRVRGLRELEYERQIKKLDIEGCGDDPRGKLEREIAILRLEENERAIVNTKRELSVFYKLADMLKQQVGELNAERRWQLENELWEFRVREMAALDIGSGRSHFSEQTIEHMIALPADTRKRLLDDLKSGKLLKWYHALDREKLLPQVEQKIMEILREALDDSDSLHLLGSLKEMNDFDD